MDFQYLTTIFDANNDKFNKVADEVEKRSKELDKVLDALGSKSLFANTGSANIEQANKLLANTDKTTESIANNFKQISTQVKGIAGGGLNLNLGKATYDKNINQTIDDIISGNLSGSKATQFDQNTAKLALLEAKRNLTESSSALTIPLLRKRIELNKIELSPLEDKFYNKQELTSDDEDKLNTLRRHINSDELKLASIQTKRAKDEISIANEMYRQSQKQAKELEKAEQKQQKDRLSRIDVIDAEFKELGAFGFSTIKTLLGAAGVGIGTGALINNIFNQAKNFRELSNEQSIYGDNTSLAFLSGITRTQRLGIDTKGLSSLRANLQDAAFGKNAEVINAIQLLTQSTGQSAQFQKIFPQIGTGKFNTEELFKTLANAGGRLPPEIATLLERSIGLPDSAIAAFGRDGSNIFNIIKQQEELTEVNKNQEKSVRELENQWQKLKNLYQDTGIFIIDLGTLGLQILNLPLDIYQIFKETGKRISDEIGNGDLFLRKESEPFFGKTISNEVLNEKIYRLTGSTTNQNITINIDGSKSPQLTADKVAEVIKYQSAIGSIGTTYGSY